MIEVKLFNISKSFSDREIIRDINLTVTSPMILVIVGPNGSGKTTLQKIIAGLLMPSKGQIKILKNGTLIRDRRRAIGYCSHHPLLYDELTVIENLRFFGKLYGIKDVLARPYIKNLLSIIGIDNYLSYYVRDLSYGWKKRLDIMRALLHDPDVLLLDEPFTGLDEDGKDSLLKLMKNLVERNKIVILTSPTEDVTFFLKDFGPKLITVKKLLDGTLVE